MMNLRYSCGADGSDATFSSLMALPFPSHFCIPGVFSVPVRRWEPPSAVQWAPARGPKRTGAVSRVGSVMQGSHCEGGIAPCSRLLSCPAM